MARKKITKRKHNRYIRPTGMDPKRLAAIHRFLNTWLGGIILLMWVVTTLAQHNETARLAVGWTVLILGEAYFAKLIVEALLDVWRMR